MLFASTAAAQAITAAPPQAQHAGGEASLVLPDLSQATFLGGIGGRALLPRGLLVFALGLLFWLAIFTQLPNLPLPKTMLGISGLLYATCKTYLFMPRRFPLCLLRLI